MPTLASNFLIRLDAGLSELRGLKLQHVMVKSNRKYIIKILKSKYANQLESHTEQELDIEFTYIKMMLNVPNALYGMQNNFGQTFSDEVGKINIEMILNIMFYEPGNLIDKCKEMKMIIASFEQMFQNVVNHTIA